MGDSPPLNRLWGMRSYLIGAIDRVEDGGMAWRDAITPWLEEHGVVVLNPLRKPIDIGIEDLVHRDRRRTLRLSGDLGAFAEEMRQIRVVDLRMTDMADFLIAKVDPEQHLCGSYEEIFWANRLKRPVLCEIVGGRRFAPDYLVGTLPQEHLFNNMQKLLEYLGNVDRGIDNRHFKRWMFFDYRKMMPKVEYGSAYA